MLKSKEIRFSVFNSVTENNPSGSISLQDWYQATRTGGKWKPLIRSIRSEPNHDKQKTLKMKLPLVSPSAMLKTRMRLLSNTFIKHSGLMQFDIDGKDNPHITNWPEIREALKEMPEVCFCSLSVSGNGLYGFVLVENPDQLNQHFLAITKDFEKRGIKLDPSKGERVTDLRFFSWDPEAWINRESVVYTKKAVPLAPNLHFDVPQIPYVQSCHKASKQSAEISDHAVLTKLQQNGWRLFNQHGNKYRLTRPGKHSGISAEYDTSLSLLYVWSSNTPFAPNRAYNKQQILQILNH
jgi:hypothetical protein